MKTARKDVISSPEALRIFNGDCVDPQQRIPDGSVNLGIYDPPFGINEGTFDKHYNRDQQNVISGYKEAPKDYEQWTFYWLSEAVRVLEDNGSMFVFSGHTNLRHVLNAADALGLHLVNQLIWKYSFGLYCKKQFVTSHYNILYYAKSKKTKRTFNTYYRFGPDEKTEKGGKACYLDRESVISIRRQYRRGIPKNQNALPDELIEKLMSYASNPGDLVCDFFLGNFTTAYAALKLGRRVTGYEINPLAYEYHMPTLLTTAAEKPMGKELIVINYAPNGSQPVVLAALTDWDRVSVGTVWDTTTSDSDAEWMSFVACVEGSRVCE